MKLLTREEFRKLVFSRDKNKCVQCGEPGVDPHHILERRLFPDGGYYLDNGATLCQACHLNAEKTVLAPWIIRHRAGIKEKVLPPDFNPFINYDKWGNIIDPLTFKRTWGKLKGDEAMNKILRAAKLYHLYE